MEIFVIGGVAAGTKAAAKLKRENSDYNVTLITKEKNISYAGCGLPYYVGGIIADRKDLFVKTPEQYEILTEVKVFTEFEAKEIIKDQQEVIAEDLKTNEKKSFRYDKLIIATGAEPFVPQVEGKDLKGIFTMRTPEDAISMRNVLETKEVKRAVVIGGGFIGIEAAENLVEQGIKVTLIEMALQILPGFDEEIAYIAEDYLLDKGVMVLTGEKVLGFEGNEKVEKIVTDKRKMKADMIVMSVGVKPNTELAQKAGILLGERGAIRVDEHLQTSNENIYAVGDCAENHNLITGNEVWYPMGSTANKMGRVAALHIAGQQAALEGVLGTTIVKIFAMNAAKTGLSETAARDAGFNPVSVIVPANDRAHYYPGAKNIITKLIADKNSHRILGAQIIGQGAVDKPIDILATAIAFSAKVEDIEKLDLAYAPPFSMAMSSTIVAANVLLNKISGKFDSITPREFWRNKDNYKVIDVRTKIEFDENHIDGALNIPMDALNNNLQNFKRDEPLLLVCKIGKNAYLAYKKLKALGFENIKALEGGMAIPQK